MISKRSASRCPLNVVIAGGGIAALELLLALNALAGDRVAVTIVAPEAHFTYRPPSPGEPLTLGHTRRYRLQRLADDLGALLIPHGLAAVSPGRHEITTTSGNVVPYDALVVAVGARAVPAFQHAVTVGAQDTSEALTALLADLGEGDVRSVAFVVPGGASWTLPMYELAVSTARHSWAIGLERPRYWFVTPEPAPLAVLGPAGSRALHDVLEPEGITFIGSAYAEVEQGAVLLDAQRERINVDRIVCLPVLEGPGTPGLPLDSNGFIPVDADGHVPTVPDVYAAGDATASRIRQGGLACQQADAVAELIAAAAGAAIEPTRYHPVLRGKLITGGRDRYLRSGGATGPTSDAVSEHPLWWPPTTIAGRYLSSHLADRDALDAGDATGSWPHIAVELPLDDPN